MIFFESKVRSTTIKKVHDTFVNIDEKEIYLVSDGNDNLIWVTEWDIDDSIKEEFETPLKKIQNYHLAIQIKQISIIVI